MSDIRLCTADEFAPIAAIINEAALAYKGVIPADRWHEPYMPERDLHDEIAHGVRFYGYEFEGQLVGVMGLQDVKDVTLVRHAYVLSDCQGRGVGRALLDHVSQLTGKSILIGAWKAATWAVRFYQRNGFELMSEGEKTRLLQCYWTIPDRQVEESVVLAKWRR